MTSVAHDVNLDSEQVKCSFSYCKYPFAVKPQGSVENG